MTETTPAATREQLAADLKAVVRDAEALLQSTAGEVGDRIRDARARAEDTIRSAKDRLDEMERSVVDQAKEATRATDEYVREHPWAAVGIAAGVGLVVGLLLSRK